MKRQASSNMRLTISIALGNAAVLISASVVRRGRGDPDECRPRRVPRALDLIFHCALLEGFFATIENFAGVLPNTHHLERVDGLSRGTVLQ